MQLKIFVFNPFMENTCLLYDDTTKEGVIIDAGCLTQKEQHTLSHYVANEKITVRRLINTHLHLDHVCGNGFAARTYGVEPEAHHADEFLLRQFSAYAAEAFGVDRTDPAQPLGGYLQEGDTISFGNETLTAIHVPGHSPGSLCYYSAGAGVLFAGDVLFRGSIGRTDLPGGNYDQLIDGITEKLFTLPDNTVVYCGHGQNTTIGHEKVYNPYF